LSEDIKKNNAVIGFCLITIPAKVLFSDDCAGTSRNELPFDVSQAQGILLSQIDQWIIVWREKLKRPKPR
jgi:hypothetical protein